MNGETCVVCGLPASRKRRVRVGQGDRPIVKTLATCERHRDASDEVLALAALGGNAVVSAQLRTGELNLGG